MNDRKKAKKKIDKQIHYSFLTFATILIATNALYFIFKAGLNIKIIPCIILAIANIFLLYNVVIAYSSFSALRLVVFSVLFSYPSIALYSVLCLPVKGTIICIAIILALSCYASVELYKHNKKREGFIIKEFLIVETSEIASLILSVFGIIVNLLF